MNFSKEDFRAAYFAGCNYDANVYTVDPNDPNDSLHGPFEKWFDEFYD